MPVVNLQRTFTKCIESIAQSINTVSYATGTVTDADLDPELRRTVAVVWDGVPERIRLTDSVNHVKVAFLTVVDSTETAAKEVRDTLISGIILRYSYSGFWNIPS